MQVKSEKWDKEEMMMKLPNDVMNSEYLVFLNEEYGTFSRNINIEGYELCGWISFEELHKVEEKNINHYVVIALVETGYYIYDDLLVLQPGGFQGGFVPKNSSGDIYDENLEFFSEKVPIVIYKRKQYYYPMPVNNTDGKPQLRRSERLKSKARQSK